MNDENGTEPDNRIIEHLEAEHIPRRPNLQLECAATDQILSILEALQPLQADRVLSSVLSHTKERFALLGQGRQVRSDA